MDNNTIIVVVVILALVIIAVILGYSGRIKAYLKLPGGVSGGVEAENHPPQPQGEKSPQSTDSHSRQKQRSTATGEDITAKQNVTIKSKDGDASGKRIKSGGDVNITTGDDSPKA